MRRPLRVRAATSCAQNGSVAAARQMRQQKRRRQRLLWCAAPRLCVCVVRDMYKEEIASVVGRPWRVCHQRMSAAESRLESLTVAQHTAHQQADGSYRMRFQHPCEKQFHSAQRRRVKCTFIGTDAMPAAITAHGSASSSSPAHISLRARLQQSGKAKSADRRTGPYAPPFLCAHESSTSISGNGAQRQ
jgi:hypothetical protein